MAGKVVPIPPAEPFEYELIEDDERLRTVVTASCQSRFWVDPGTLKLRQRIGRGPFGDVYIATQHLSASDYDEFHEVAVKMLHPVRDDQVNVLVDKFESLFSMCDGLDGICVFHGVSVMLGKLCILMKFYESSVADRMAQLKGGKLLLPDVLRHGIKVAQAISELHGKEILVLNLKCSNILLDDLNEAIVGDVGIPYALLGIPLPGSDMSRRLGTPNYMAPEQWRPEVRGPISYETDSWGFGCCMVEMLTGAQPWCGNSADVIHESVVVKQEKPKLPDGLPPLLQTIIMACFEYDLRNRPRMSDIVRVLRCCENGISRDSKSTALDVKTVPKEWFLTKDQLTVGDTVRSRRQPSSRNPEAMSVPEGTVVGLEGDGDVLVRVHGIHDPLRVPSSSLERVSFGLSAGDWVRLKEEDKNVSQVGILHSIDRRGKAAVGFIGMETLWRGDSGNLQMAESFVVGQFVKIKASVLSPRFEWPRKGRVWATGRVARVHGNGCLAVRFPGRLALGKQSRGFVADPCEVEAVSFGSCGGIAGKYQHLEDFHWAVRPILIVFGVFTAFKIGGLVGKKVGRSDGRKQLTHGDAQSGGDRKAGWLPPPLANIFGASSR